MIQRYSIVNTIQRSLNGTHRLAYLLCATVLFYAILPLGLAQEATQSTPDASASNASVTNASATSASATSAKRTPVISNPSDVEVWEYSPYRARVWLSISPTLGLSEITQQQIREKVAQLVEIEFGATLQCDVVETPDALFGSVLYHLDDLTIDQLLSRELVLMLAKSDQAKEAFLAQQPKKNENASAELLNKMGGVVRSSPNKKKRT